MVKAGTRWKFVAGKVAPMNLNKYKAKKVCIDGIWFDSKAEGRHYGTLKLLERAGKIRQLKCHPRYPIVINGIPVGRYSPDFTFIDAVDGKRKFQDVKNPITRSIAMFRIRVFEAVYRVKVELVGLPGKKFVDWLGYVDEKISDEDAKRIVADRKKARDANRSRNRTAAHLRTDGQEAGSIAQCGVGGGIPSPAEGTAQVVQTDGDESAVTTKAAEEVPASPRKTGD